ncbi:MAG TPA: nucleotidyl transferase AbiEii/AbiGii toxin family protein, partial [Anaeromyxobacteraceae bacterium]|nr:nucleotidyl transferase AbiEii/AbiGii toxin family protein [Anaeromyxobacteraceae bacterium]
LHFTRLLCAGPDKLAFAVKGGCNLRFFFESARYSEDIDFDVTERVPVHALKDRVAGILSGPALTLALRNRGIEVAAVSAPKQTETTQRWKVALSVTGHPLPLPTKIEFSRRGATEEAVLEPIAPGVLEEHQSMLFLAPHYPAAAALRQKVRALAGRREVQARDVFDLGSVLIPRVGGRIEELRSGRTDLRAAMERAMTLSYADFKAQVGSYLRPEQLDAHGTPEAWDAMQMLVVDYLDRATSRARGEGR